jgi:hypothetical protein
MKIYEFGQIVDKKASGCSRRFRLGATQPTQGALPSS